MKVLENIKDMMDEMGPGSICDHLEFIVGFIELLLDKKAPCQTGVTEEDGQGPKDEAVEEEEDESDEEEYEDLDHDELILGNASDLVITLAKCLQDSFLPYLQRLGPKIVQYCGNQHSASDKIMAIGTLGETFNQCPSAISVYFNDFIQVLIRSSTTDNSSLNRNVSYGIGICADKAQPEQFEPHLQTALQAIKQMHMSSDDEAAKDNCIACIVRILEKYHAKLPLEESDVLFQQIMSAVPLQGDPGENQTILKFIMSINASSPEKVRPYMSQITVVCLMLLTDSRCNNEVDEAFKMLTASFIKNVIMSSGDEFVQQLQTLEGQMSEDERTTLQKYMATA